MRNVYSIQRRCAVLLVAALLPLSVAGAAPGQAEVRDLAPSAVRFASQDAQAWQLVAISRYLMGDLTGALEAWNRTGDPRIDTIDIFGAERVPGPVVVRATGLQIRQVLTPDAFGRARRRLDGLPVVWNARMNYEPRFSEEGGGLAKVDVFIEERPVLPTRWSSLATLGARALLLDELAVDIAGSLGAGETVSAAWRWSAARPRVRLGLAFPSPRGFPGIVSFDWLWERQSYDATPSSADATLVREERRKVGLHLADWSTRWLRWQTGAALDRLPEFDDLDGKRFALHDYLAVDTTLDVRLADDRLSLAATGGWWVPFAGGDRFGTGGLLAAWRSTDDPTLSSWSSITRLGLASRAAPLALWPGAGTGRGRGTLLRAHPLLDADVVTGPAFGRQVAGSSFEYRRAVGLALPVRFSIAGFVDAAQARQRLIDLETSPFYVDAGGGVRLHAPGGSVMRIDVARGLRGGGTTLSASWGDAWPR
jgi:hypothetical protein